MAVVSKPQAVWPVEAELGEGPVWAEGALWFVDIKKKHVHRLSPDGAQQSWDAPEQIGFFLPAQGGGFVAGLESGLFRFDAGSGAFTKIIDVEPALPGNRLNDGVVDPKGRLWFGSMDNGEKEATGRFYCCDAGNLRDSGIPPVPITNGPAFSPDGSILYWVDTLGQTINAADVAEDGTLGESRQIVKLGEKEGFPDGPSVDSEGCVWISLYWGWSARRYSPAGELLETVEFPVSNITKLTFGGDDLCTAYATTARQGIAAEDMADQPQAGALFSFRVDVPGFPSPHVRL